MKDGISPTRTKSTWKPRVEAGDLCFFRRDDGVALNLGSRPASIKKDNWRSLIHVPPYCAIDESQQDNENADISQACMGDAFPCVEASASEQVLWFRFVGGFDSAAVEVYWDESQEAEPPWLIALKTFTGIQIKYPTPGKRPPLIFALADEDAYCYCDLDPCQACVANCKRGFILYAWYGKDTILKVPCKE